MLDHESDTHLYVQVADVIRQRALAGHLYTVSQRGTHVSPPEEWPDAAEADT